MNKLITSLLVTLSLASCTNIKTKKEEDNSTKLPFFGLAGKLQLPQTKMLPPTFDITKFGAIANDSKDDTEAIQAAINAAENAGGGTVLIPKGRYVVLSDVSTKVIEINHSNIHIKGEGQGSDGSIIVSMNPRTQHKDEFPWLSPSVFHTGLKIHDTYSFYDIKDQKEKHKVQKDTPKGNNIITIDSTEGIKSGDVILIGMQNLKDQPSLMKKLMNQVKFESFQTSYIQAKEREDWSYQWFTRVSKVIDKHNIELTHALRHTLETKYNASVVKMPMLQNITFSNLRFESTWKGGYVHHKTKEFDYGWSAIALNRVINGHIQNITIHNYTQGVQLVNSCNSTIEDISITGIPGHYSVKLYHSNDNLFQNINVEAERTHGPSIEGASQGNVFRLFTFKTPQPLDLHGLGGIGFMPPMNNLFEQMSNVIAVMGGAAPQNTPHAGPGNVFYNIEMTGKKHGKYLEVFHSWIYQTPDKFKIEKRDDCHIQYIGSKVIGVYNTNKTLTVDHKVNNILNKEVMVQDLNQKPKTASLFLSQKEALLK
ncbi:hypothetical protein K4L44_12445 [Halosquirtibacter laminarini]|uniref:Uncharacterized protein n=1 Tax=Halosquirtibacter laminarini TaxID=3374600 RepID=A0AC61NCX9_9BACT|nr:hypothetical protein K4L44_12445 [Prolixibacteraceae bacterium]